MFTLRWLAVHSNVLPQEMGPGEPATAYRLIIGSPFNRSAARGSNKKEVRSALHRESCSSTVGSAGHRLIDLKRVEIGDTNHAKFGQPVVASGAIKSAGPRLTSVTSRGRRGWWWKIKNCDHLKCKINRPVAREFLFFCNCVGWSKVC